MSTLLNNILKLTIAVIVTSSLVNTVDSNLIKVNKDKPLAIQTTSGSISVVDQEHNHKGLETRGIIRGQLLLGAVAAFPRENVVCSPLAALIPLVKLALGASSGTLAELLTAVGVSEREELRTTFKPLIKSLTNLTSVSVKLANEIFVNKKYRLKSNYSEDANDIFLTAGERISYKSAALATQKINNWVQQHTHGTFHKNVWRKLIPGKDEVESAVLINSVIFKGKWPEPFAVTVGDFKSVLGKDKIKMMTKTSTYSYLQSTILHAQFIEIPYQGNEASFVIVLPNQSKHNTGGLVMLLNTLKVAPYVMDTEMQKMKPRTVSLTFPMFKTETEIDLSQMLKTMHLLKLIAPGISEMVRGKSVVVASAIQKMVLEVTEGVKTPAHLVAASTTSPPDPASSNLSTSDLQATEFRASRPFLYFVKVGREPLFAGIYMHK